MNKILKDKLEQLENETNTLFGSIDALSEEQLHDDSYGWSIIQVLSHLNVAESGTVIYMTKKMKAGDKMPEYGLSNKIRMALTKRLLNSSLKWKAPRPVAHPRADYSYEEIKQQWKISRQKTRSFVEEYPDKYLNKAVFKHPMAGRLDIASAIDSLTHHQRHHLHQIRRIKKSMH